MTLTNAPKCKCLHIVKMMDIGKEAVGEFNKRQRETASIGTTFVSADQDPWKDCSKDFKAHLDRLSELLLEIRMIKSCEGLLLKGEVEGQVEEGGSGKGDVEVKESGGEVVLRMEH